MLHDLFALKLQSHGKVGLRALPCLAAYYQWVRGSKGQCMYEAFGNYKALQDLELLFSSDYKARDGGSRNGECATLKEVREGGEAAHMEKPTSKAFSVQRG